MREIQIFPKSRYLENQIVPVKDFPETWIQEKKIALSL